MPAAETCAACGGALHHSFFVLHGGTERFCAACMQSRPRCSGCGAPVGQQHWRLHDSRVLCARCHLVAVYDPAEAATIFAATVASVEQQLGLKLRVGVAFRLVDVPTMTQLRAEGGVASDALQVMGLYQRQGALRMISVLYGLPRLAFRTTVAHEYAHAWQTENCPLLEDDLLREGFAEWVAYHHLRFLGCSRAAEDMRTSSHPYQPMFESVLAIEGQRGIAGVIAHLLAVGRGL
ncbi:MAG: protein DA1 [Roseiflexaceae bacterium]|nr:protein DA1 [Roseiflexaceae bacterium]